MPMLALVPRTPLMFAAVSGSLECVRDLNAPINQCCDHLSASSSASFYLANQRLPLVERCNARSDMHLQFFCCLSRAPVVTGVLSISFSLNLMLCCTTVYLLVCQGYLEPSCITHSCLRTGQTERQRLEVEYLVDMGADIAATDNTEELAAFHR